MAQIRSRKKVFATPWFEIVAKDLQGEDGEPHFALSLDDYVAVLAMTVEGEVVLVRQFRPAVESDTLELPSGHVERGETPETAASRELLEETGYEAAKPELLGCLSPDTGRLSNRMWCYLVRDVRRKADWTPEPGIEVLHTKYTDFLELIRSGSFTMALHVAAVGLATLKGKLG